MDSELKGLLLGAYSMYMIMDKQDYNMVCTL